MPTATQERIHPQVKVRAVNRDNLTVDIVASTDSLDSYNSKIDPAGWDLAQFKRNPQILWAHDDRGYTASAGLPVAKALPDSVRVDGGKLLMTLQFTPKDVNDFGYKVFQLVSNGFFNGLSVGFQPIKWTDDEDDTGKSIRTYTQQKLCEVSVVTIPANDDALVMGRSKEMNLEADKMRGMAVEVEQMAEERLREMRGVVPKDVSDEKAPITTPWQAPSLSDFTSTSWDDLSDEDKQHIAGHYAWAAQLPPKSFGDLKLPHHRASDGKVVFRGVVAAAGRLDQAEIPSGDLPKVKAHLRKHYEQFGMDVPASLEDGAEDADDTATEKSAPLYVEKCINYFEQKQPINKKASAVLKKFYIRILDQEPPADEGEAWDRMGEAVDATEKKEEDEEEKPQEAATEEPSNTPAPAEAPQDERKASVHISLAAVTQLPTKLGEAMKAALEEALRGGMPVSEAGAFLDALGEKLKASFIFPLSK